MILNFLYGSSVNNFTIPEFYNYLNYLNHIGVNNELLDYFNRLATNNRNKNPMNFLDTLTEEHLGRAKKIVYEAVTKK